jgi:hypothetical protein
MDAAGEGGRRPMKSVALPHCSLIESLHQVADGNAVVGVRPPSQGTSTLQLKGCILVPASQGGDNNGDKFDAYLSE